MRLFTCNDGSAQRASADHLKNPRRSDRVRLPWLNAAIFYNPRVGRAFFERADVSRDYTYGGVFGAELAVWLSRIADDLDIAIKLDPNNADAYDLRASTKLKQGLLTEALEDSEQAVALDPTKVLFRNGRGNILRRMKEWQLAIENTNAAIEIEPGVWEHYESRGSLLLEAGDYEAAYRDFSQVMDLGEGSNRRSNNAWSLHRRGNALAAMGNPDEALADHSQASKDRYWWAGECSRDRAYWRGRGLASRDDLEGAIASYSQAIQLDPEFDDALRARGQAFRKMGNDDAAQRDFAKLREITRKSINDGI